MQRDVTLLVIGALISLLTTIFLQMTQFLISRYQVNKGKVNLYTKSVYSKLNSKPWGIYRLSSGESLIIPLWIELHNTKGKKEVIRNINLILYQGDKKIKSMVQSSHYKNSEGIIVAFGNEGTYTFILEPESIVRYNLQFNLRKDTELEFDTIRISYYDTKDKYCEYLFLDVPDGWRTKNTKIDDEWIKINK
ncbi:hypothetical protein [Enterococcus gallinarum]|uniref:hypothetical protein n=1 Tax=Lactobacillales TaxID=186826 RepID=UPI001AD6BF0E|nr:hypothetical protein [Enterococcus gallinarum]MBO6417450.1 hypothetical protein [Enterococcus gallinarum]MBO6423254.1 hypothetical protein [Enterococcus gallinarum]